PTPPSTSSFIHHCHTLHRHLHSFPTRRSSDLPSKSPPPPAKVCPSSFSCWTIRHTTICKRCKNPPTYAPPRASWLAWTTNPSRKDRKSTRLNSSHVAISYAVFCLKKKT